MAYAVGSGPRPAPSPKRTEEARPPWGICAGCVGLGTEDCMYTCNRQTCMSRVGTTEQHCTAQSPKDETSDHPFKHCSRCFKLPFKLPLRRMSTPLLDLYSSNKRWLCRAGQRRWAVTSRRRGQEEGAQLRPALPGCTFDRASLISSKEAALLKTQGKG